MTPKSSPSDTKYDPDHAQNGSGNTRTSPAAIALAWIIVAIPLARGVYNTGLNAAKLFSAQPAAATAPSNPSAPR